MTAYDDAVKAAAEAIRRSVWGDYPVTDDWTVEAEAAVAAAAPILLAAERQRIAEAIRAEPPLGSSEDAARQALADFAADLRELCDDNQGLYAYAEQGLVDAVECHRIRAVIDRHASATPTTEEDR